MNPDTWCCMCPDKEECHKLIKNKLEENKMSVPIFQVGEVFTLSEIKKELETNDQTNLKSYDNVEFKVLGVKR